MAKLKDKLFFAYNEANILRLGAQLFLGIQLQETLGAEFYTRIGMNEWADTNGIIVLYPQAHAVSVSDLPPTPLAPMNINPNGCWNWWGYSSDTQFLTKQGVQISAIWSMVQRLTGRGN